MGRLRIRKSLGCGRAVDRLLRTRSQWLRKRLRHLPSGSLLSTGRLLRIISTRMSRAV